MPFFPALVKHSSAIQRFLSSIRALRSRVTWTKSTGGTSSTTHSSGRGPLKAFRAEEDYIELGEAKILTEPARVQGSNTYRMEFEGFRDDGR